MHVVEGRVTLVQESRFQVIDGEGLGHLFVLSPHASAEPAHLEPLARSQARVRVHACEGRDILGAVAHRVEVGGGEP